MKLLTKALIKKFPKLYDTQNKKPEEVKVVAKFFTPWSNWTWYATEFDGTDRFFGYVKGFEYEFGYFSLAELEKIKGPAGLRIERDRFFGNKTLKEIML